MTKFFPASQGSDVSPFASVTPSDLGLLCLRLHSALPTSQQRACLARSRRASPTLVSARLFEARAGSLLAACFAELLRNTIRMLLDGGPPKQRRFMSPFAKACCHRKLPDLHTSYAKALLPA